MSVTRRIRNPLTESEFSEYEILYTYDVTQKKKRWNDGRLQFFEFNKKLDVFDDSGKLILSDFYKLGQKGGMDYKILKAEEILKLRGNDNTCSGGIIVEIVQLLNVYIRDISHLTKNTGKSDPTEIYITNRRVGLDYSKAKNSNSLDTNKITPIVPQRKIRVGLSRRQFTTSKTATQTTYNKPEKNEKESPTELNDFNDASTTLQSTTTVSLPGLRHTDETCNEPPNSKIQLNRQVTSSVNENLYSLKRNSNELNTGTPLAPSKTTYNRTGYKISELGNNIGNLAKRAKIKQKETLTDDQFSKVDVYASPDEDEISEISDDESSGAFGNGNDNTKSNNSVRQMKVTDISRYIL